MLSKNNGPPRMPLPAVNRLINRLPRGERPNVMARCEPVELSFGTVLCEALKPIQYVYFPVTGVISLVKPLVHHEPLETEQIGSEGMLGATLAMGVEVAPLRGVVQGSGTALRMTTAELQSSIQDSPALLALLQRYLYVTMMKLSQTIACTRFHNVAARLAHGLLMTHDQVHRDHFHLTHQFLADLLGVQRGAVTIAAGILQQKRIIHYTRGEITILDRKALEAESCECYGAFVSNYTRFLS